MKKMFSTLLFLISSFAFAEPEVTRHQFSSLVQDREPVDSLTDAMNPSPLYYFTELTDMEGMVITHRWQYNGEVMAEVVFNVAGPRWRVYSTKTLLPEWDGVWTVDVIDEYGVVLVSDQISISVD